jgi:hypothetical protein
VNKHNEKKTKEPIIFATDFSKLDLNGTTIFETNYYFLIFNEKTQKETCSYNLTMVGVVIIVEVRIVVVIGVIIH